MLSKHDMELYKSIRLEPIDYIYENIDSLKIKQYQISIRNTQLTSLGNINLLNLLLFMTALEMKIANLIYEVDFSKGVFGIILYDQGAEKIMILDAYIPYIMNQKNQNQEKRIPEMQEQ